MLFINQCLAGVLGAPWSARREGVPLMHPPTHRGPHTASAPVRPPSPQGFSGICDSCSEHTGHLREYWNGWFVCGICYGRLVLADAKFGIRFGG